MLFLRRVEWDGMSFSSLGLLLARLWAGPPANAPQRRSKREERKTWNSIQQRQFIMSEVNFLKWKQRREWNQTCLMKWTSAAQWKEMNWTGNQAATAARQAHQQTKTANPSTHFSKRKKSESWLELLCLLNGKSCKSTNQFFSQFLQLLKKWRRMVVEWVNWKVIITVNRLHRN